MQMPSDYYFDREAEYQVLRRLMKRTEEDNRTAQLVGKALRDELTERQYTMVRMYYLEQRTMQAIGDALGVNKSTVSRTLCAARMKLKRCLRYINKSLLRDVL